MYIFFLTRQCLNKSDFSCPTPAPRKCCPFNTKPLLRFLGVPHEISLAFTFYFLITRCICKTAQRELSSLLRPGSKMSVGLFFFFSDLVGVLRESWQQRWKLCRLYSATTQDRRKSTHVGAHRNSARLGVPCVLQEFSTQHQAPWHCSGPAPSLHFLMTWAKHQSFSAQLLTLNYFFGHFKFLMLERCKIKCSTQWSHCITAYIVTFFFSLHGIQ